MNTSSSIVYFALTEEAGQLKTTVVERALAAYFEEYDRKQEILRKHENDV